MEQDCEKEIKDREEDGNTTGWNVSENGCMENGNPRFSLKKKPPHVNRVNFANRKRNNAGS